MGSFTGRYKRRKGRRSMKLTEELQEVIEEALEKFELHIEEILEQEYDNEVEQWENGEFYTCWDAPSDSQIEGVKLCEDLQKIVSDSRELKNKVIMFCWDNFFLDLHYEKLGNPFHYGGPWENEIDTVNNSGDKEVYLEFQYLKNHLLNFDLTEYFEESSKFEEEFNSDYSDLFYALHQWNKDNKKYRSGCYIHDNYDYDVVRVLLNVDAYLCEIEKEFNKPEYMKYKTPMGKVLGF